MPFPSMRREPEYVHEEEIDDRPWPIKALSNFPLPEEIKTRLNQKPYAKQLRLNEETFSRTHGDVMKERLGEFEGRERMGDSLDNAHNFPFGRFYTPMGLYNKRHKDKFREAFKEMGIERKN